MKILLSLPVVLLSAFSVPADDPPKNPKGEIRGKLGFKSRKADFDGTNVGQEGDERLGAFAPLPSLFTNTKEPTVKPFFPDPTPPDDERLVDHVGQDFWGIEQMLDPGLQVLLEAHNVSREARHALRGYVDGVIKELLGLEREVTKLARVPGAEKAGYRGIGEGKEVAKHREPDLER